MSEKNNHYNSLDDETPTREMKAFEGAQWNEEGGYYVLPEEHVRQETKDKIITFLQNLKNPSE